MDIIGNAPTIGASSDAETRPMNMYFDFIIKLEHSVTGLSQADLPAGSIFPFTGSVADAFPGGGLHNQYLLCDGTLVAASDVPDLVQEVGSKFQHDQSQSGVFQPPDLRDYFIRGVSDSDSDHDPEVDHRAAAPDGSKAGIGTTQSWATKLLNAYFSIPGLNTNSGQSSGCTKGGSVSGLADEQYTSVYTLSGGDSETAPYHQGVNFFMNAINPSAQSEPTLPIGAIVAIAGQSFCFVLQCQTPPAHTRLSGLPQESTDARANLTDHFLLCNGQQYDKTRFPDLAKLYSSLWGNPVSRSSKFRVPDLRQTFLRGAVPGSLEVGDMRNFSTAAPRAFSVSINSYPTEEYNVLGGAGNTVYESAYDKRDIPLTATWDSETAPVYVSVDFWVRAR